MNGKQVLLADTYVPRGHGVGAQISQWDASPSSWKSLHVLCIIRVCGGMPIPNLYNYKHDGAWEEQCGGEASSLMDREKFESSS